LLAKQSVEVEDTHKKKDKKKKKKDADTEAAPSETPVRRNAEYPEVLLSALDNGVKTLQEKWRYG
jgi:hypothetical protein